MGRVTDSTRIRTVRVRDGKLYAGRKGDHVAVEEPLDIRLNGQQLSLTMRTPGNDVELIHGFLHAEGLIRDREDVAEARYCDGAVVDAGSGFAQNTYNVMDFTTTRPQLLPQVARAFTTTSACGVCGAESIDAVRQKSRYTLLQSWVADPHVILRAARELSDQQAVFARTGGVHAAALVDLEGNLLVVREDVGRHNAVDKVIGWALLEDRLPLRDCFLLVSSRHGRDPAGGLRLRRELPRRRDRPRVRPDARGLHPRGGRRGRPHEPLHPPRAPRPLRRGGLTDKGSGLLLRSGLTGSLGPVVGRARRPGPDGRLCVSVPGRVRR